MMKTNSKKKKRDLLNAHVCAGLTKDDKLALRRYKIENKTTYAALIREALYEKYPQIFENRHE